jgi:hypothetical protein
MRLFLLFLLALVVIAIVVSGFYVGHYRLPNEGLAKAAGMVFGVLSASFWGLSTISNPTFNAIFNFFAAVFAAISLGYLT